MGQAARRKAATDAEGPAPASPMKVRLQMIHVIAEYVTVDKAGRFSGRGTTEKRPLFVMEAGVPPEIFELLKKNYPELRFEAPPEA